MSLSIRLIIKDWRAKKNFSQAKMAELLQLNTQQHYSDIENGRVKKIPFDVVEKFKKISGIKDLGSYNVPRENHVEDEAGDYQPDLQTRYILLLERVNREMQVEKISIEERLNALQETLKDFLSNQERVVQQLSQQLVAASMPRAEGKEGTLFHKEYDQQSKGRSLKKHRKNK